MDRTPRIVNTARKNFLDNNDGETTSNKHNEIKSDRTNNNNNNNINIENAVPLKAEKETTPRHGYMCILVTTAVVTIIAILIVTLLVIFVHGNLKQGDGEKGFHI